MKNNKQILKNMKNQKKQTAVEWLMEIDKYTDLTIEEWQHAKKMEKKQMIGLLQWMNRVTQSDPMRLETDDDDVVEQYYEQTFGGNNEQQ